MRRILSLYLPYWPADRLRRALGKSAPSDDTPLVLLTNVGSKRIVCSVDEPARAIGIRPGMAAIQAHAITARLYAVENDAQADSETLQKLAQWILRRYSPIVAADRDGLMIDATGCAHLFGGEEAMLRDLVSRLKAVGITARAAMAHTYGAAHALARFKRQDIFLVENTGGEAALDPLPVAALRLPPTTVTGLGKLGFDTIAELKAAPRAPLALRFGTEPGRRLDQALGYVFEPFDLILPPDPVYIRRAFAEPISAPETIARYIGLLTEALCKRLETRVQGASCLDLLFTRVDNSLQSVRIRLSRPMRDGKRLSRLLADRLETVDPGFGIEAMRLSASRVEPLERRQIHLDVMGKTVPDPTGLIDTLSNRIGAANVYRLAQVESDIPERSIAPISPLAQAPQDNAQYLPRPPRLFARPEPIETIAMLPDYPPVSFTWRGRRHKVRAADGPERIFGEWWKFESEMETVRDYFQLEDESGARFWIYRDGDGMLSETGSQKWFLHGIFA